MDIISTRAKIEKKSVSFKVKKTTSDQLTDLKKRVKNSGESIDFRLDDVVDEQLVKMIARANKQLDKLEINV